jgi:hypothetical protein
VFRFYLALFALIFSAQTTTYGSTLPLEEEIVLAAKHQLSRFYYRDESHIDNFSFTEVTLDQTTHSADHLYACGHKREDGTVEELFIKVNYHPKELSHHRMLTAYLQDHTYPELKQDLCLPVTSYEKAKEPDTYRILVFPRATGVSMDKIVGKYLDGELSLGQLEEIFQGLGAMISRLNRAGELTLNKGKLKTTCIHRDLHDDNIFWDLKRNCGQLIDLETIAESISKSQLLGKKTNVHNQLFIFFLQSLQCSALFYEPCRFPAFSLFGAFLKGYGAESGYKPADINPVLYQYAMKILRDAEGMMTAEPPQGVDSSDEYTDEEAVPLELKSKEERLQIISEFAKHLKTALNLEEEAE